MTVAYVPAELLPLAGRSFKVNDAVRNAGPVDLAASDGPAGSDPDPLVRWTLEDRDRDTRLVVDAYSAALRDEIERSPGPVEGFARFASVDLDRTLARLVLDNVLEIESHEGRFVRGAEAVGEVMRPVEHRAVAARIGERSHDAISYALALGGIASYRQLVRRVYRFNSHLHVRRTSRLVDAEDDGAAFLGLGKHRPWRSYAADTTAGEQDPWWRWRHRSAAKGFRHKIYVSAHVDDLPQVFDYVTAVATAMEVPAFKVGRGLPGLSRPDKLVLYFADAASLARAADELIAGMPDCRVQGVPFTEPLTDDGLVSRALDPDPDEVPGADPVLSWRMLVSGIVSSAARSVAADTGHDAAVTYVLARLQVAGIDPDRWGRPSGATS